MASVIEKAMEALKTATVCTECRRSKLVRNGERAVPERHCTCPGGPVWQRIAALEGGDWGLALRRWRLMPETERKKYVVFPFDGELYMVPREKWEDFLEQYFLIET